MIDVLLLVGGLLLILWGANALTDGAASVARRFQISDLVIGLTIVALGTSAPEFIISLLSSINGSAEIAIGNVVGSNILNVIFVLGVASSISPLNYSSAFNIDAIFALLAPLLLFIFVLPKNKLPRWAGALMLLTYVAYFFIIW